MRSIEELDREIIGETLTSDAAYQFLSHFCRAYGPRFAGTEEERGAAQYISQQMKEYGLQDVFLKPFLYRGWRRGKTILALCHREKREILPAIGLPCSPPGQIKGKVLDVGDGTREDFASLSSQLKGKIALVSAMRPIYRQKAMHRKDKYLRAVEAGAIGFLWMREEGGHLEETGSLPLDAPIIGVGLSLETGFKIREAAREGGEVTISSDHSFFDAESFNVEGLIPGTSSGLLMVGAHYDGHDIGEGALDNGAGTAILLETARLLSKRKSSLGRSIAFVCFGAEEVGLIGSQSYVAQLKGSIDFMINLDGGPGRSGKMGVALQNSRELIMPFKEIVAEMGEERAIALYPSSHSDMYSFSKAGIPSGYLRDMDRLPKGRDWGHTRADTFDKVNRERLREDSLFLARFLLRASHLCPWPTSSS